MYKTIKYLPSELDSYICINYVSTVQEYIDFLVTAVINKKKSPMKIFSFFLFKTKVIK